MRLGESADAKWLAAEHADFKETILTATERAAKPEKETPPYPSRDFKFPRGGLFATVAGGAADRPFFSGSSAQDWKEEILVNKKFAAASASDAAPLPPKRHLLPASAHPITG